MSTSTIAIASASFRMRLLRAAQSDVALRESLVPVAAALGRAVSALGAPRDRWVLPVGPDALDDLRGVLGSQVHPYRWDVDALGREYGPVEEAVVTAGHSAAGRLVAVAAEAGVAAPTAYFAVVAQDLDSLGRALARMSHDEQRAGVASAVGAGRKAARGGRG